jgi:hypothetical protein
VIRRIEPPLTDPSRTVVPIAGNGTGGFSGVPGPAAAAEIQPGGLTFNGGNLYLTNNAVRVLTVSGNQITLVANASGSSSPPMGGPAVAATLGAIGLVFDAAGNLYAADSINKRIWKIDITGNATTIAGGGSVFIDGVTVLSATATLAKLSGPGSLAFDADGNLYTVDGPQNRILKIAANAVSQPLDGTETVTIFAGTTGQAGFAGDGGPAASAAIRGGPLAFDSFGNLFMIDIVNNVVRVLDDTPSDTGAGVAFTDPLSPLVLAAEGAEVSRAVTATDHPGNSASFVSPAVKIDREAPVISGMLAPGLSLLPADGRMVHVGTVTAADALSGLDAGSFQVTGVSNEPPSASQISITPNGAGGFDIT